MEDSLPADQIFPLILMGVLIMTAMALALIAYFNYSRRRILQAQQASQKIEIKYQEELIQNNIIIQEKERKRIAEDLHDEIGSKLNVMSLYLHQLKKTGQSIEKFDGIIADMGEALDKTISVSRNIAHELMPPTLDNFGLIPAISELLESINATGQIEIILQNRSEVKKLKDKWSEINLYRVLQEIITNSIKYGKGCSVKLQIDYKDSQLNIEYKDDGPGYDPLADSNKHGMGLGNISNRLKMINAEWTNASKLKSGTHYLIKYIDQL